MELWFEEAGQGPTVVFLHAALADSRMWEPQFTSFANTHHVLRCDLRGFGLTGLDRGSFSHGEDVVALLDTAGVERAVLVGASLGGRVALEVTLSEPDRVAGLVLAGAVVPGYDWSEEVRQFGEAEDEALEKGDLNGSVELNMSFWFDRPALSDQRRRRLRDEIASMQRMAFEHILDTPVSSTEQLAVPDAAQRLGEISVPALVVVGEHDVHDIHVIGKRLAAEIPAAELHIIANTAHVPSAEEPAEFNRLVRDFLAECDW